jgi:hypothetical protein
MPREATMLSDVEQINGWLLTRRNTKTGQLPKWFQTNDVVQQFWNVKKWKETFSVFLLFSWNGRSHVHTSHQILNHQKTQKVPYQTPVEILTHKSKNLQKARSVCETFRLVKLTMNRPIAVLKSRTLAVKMGYQGVVSVAYQDNDDLRLNFNYVLACCNVDAYL